MSMAFLGLLKNKISPLANAGSILSLEIGRKKEACCRIKGQLRGRFKKGLLGELERGNRGGKSGKDGEWEGGKST